MTYRFIDDKILIGHLHNLFSDETTALIVGRLICNAYEVGFANSAVAFDNPMLGEDKSNFYKLLDKSLQTFCDTGPLDNEPFADRIIKRQITPAESLLVEILTKRAKS